MIEERKSLLDLKDKDRDVYGMISDTYQKALIAVINNERYYRKRFNLFKFIFKNKIARNCLFILSALIAIGLMLFFKENMIYVYIAVSGVISFYIVKYSLIYMLFDKRDVCVCKSKIRKRLKG